MSKKVAICDIDSIAYSIGAGNKVLDESGNPIKVLSKAGNMVFQYVDKTEEELKQSADWIMNDVLTKCGATHYIGWMKGANTTRFRLEANPEYKQNRKQDPPSWWNFVQNYLFTYWNCRYINEMETDDAVYLTMLNLDDSFIVAIDSDILSQPGTHYNWKDNVWVTTTLQESNTLFWKSMICGTHNNTKGIPRRGEAYWKDQYQNTPQDKYRSQVLEDYVRYFGEYKGIKEFHSNYICNKILDQKEGFIVPEPIEFKKKEINYVAQ